MGPGFLRSNSDGHAGPFSAVAELIENASDRSLAVKLLCIDVEVLKGHLCLTFTDNGAGMTPRKLSHMLSFGCTKNAVHVDHRTTEPCGNSFRSSSMRLGKDAMVFTKNGGVLSVGLFSQTYLERVCAEAVVIPLVPFNQQNKKIIVTKESVPSLEAILEHTLFNTSEELLAQFDAIPGKKGTRILIWNICRNKDGKPELDFDTDQHDIRLADFLAYDASAPRRKVLRCQGTIQELPAPETEYSLRAYCSILYLKPCMQIVLRQKKVSTQLITKSLAHTRYDSYKPRFSSKRVKITFGFSCKNDNHYGIMMYHNNRLIRPYEEVGCQRRGEGVGVIGVIECNFLKPAHTKQGFEESREYRRMILALGQKLNNYWKATMKQMNSGNMDAACLIANRPDQTWVQCEECLKWRKLPNSTDPASLPEKWLCHLHPFHKYRSCLVPEELEHSDEENRPVYKQKCKMEGFLTPLFSPHTIFLLCTISNKPTLYSPSALWVGGCSCLLSPSSSSFLVSSKPKLTIKKERLERDENTAAVSPPDRTSPSLYSFSLQKSFAVPYQERQKLLCVKQEDVNVGGSLHTCLLREQLDTSPANGVSHSKACCLETEMPALLGSSGKDQKEMGVIQGGLEKQTSKLKAERWAADPSACVSACRSTKDTDKRPFLAAVTVLNATTSSGAPIQLWPFGWKQELLRSKVEKALGDEDRERKELQVFSKQGQEDITEQEDRSRAVELKNISVERDLLQWKVEEIEREKCYLKTELLKSQKELAALRAKKVEGFYWNKKRIVYCQAKLQELKAKVVKSTEKSKLMERLKDTKMHLEMLWEAQISGRGPEEGDVKSVMEKLKKLRVNVSWLLSFIIPSLELQHIDFESDQVDEILQILLEKTNI
ncbi:MORC4 protein, partial [Penelope pileata]|nr:MORC4 protein [Penelope pileata]